MLLERFVSKNTLRKLNEKSLITSKYLFELKKKKITGVLYDVLYAICYHGPKDSPDDIFKMIISLFEFKKSTAQN